MNLAEIIPTLAVYALPVLLAITVHEAAHGWAASRLGDPTARMLGRITLNPLKHIDPLGTVLLPLVLVVLTAGQFVFGYAKPVPVNTRLLRQPGRDMALVAVAGPLSNLLQALVWALLFHLLQLSGLADPFFLRMCQAAVLVNVVLMVLNLFPLPPLDGGRVLAWLLPPRLAMPYAQLERWGFAIVLLLLFSNLLDRFWLQPLGLGVMSLIDAVMLPLARLYATGG